MRGYIDPACPLLLGLHAGDGLARPCAALLASPPLLYPTACGGALGSAMTN